MHTQFHTHSQLGAIYHSSQTGMILGVGRKPENQEETHRYRHREPKLRIELHHVLPIFQTACMYIFYTQVPKHITDTGLKKLYKEKTSKSFQINSKNTKRILIIVKHKTHTTVISRSYYYIFIHIYIIYIFMAELGFCLYIE